MQILDDSISSLDESIWKQVVNECVQCIRAGGKIIASGLGKNVPICEKMVGTLNSFGIPANFLHTNTAVHGDLGVVNENDIVFILSKSGNTAESVLLAGYLLERKANTWLLSCNNDCELSKMLDKKVVLELKHEGDLWDIAPNNSTTVFLIFLQGLAVKLSEELNIPLSQFKKNHPGGSIGQKLRGEDEHTLKMSTLNKTWIFDLDGTIVEHNGYLKYGEDRLLDNIKGFLDELPSEDYVLILSARSSAYKDLTLKFLSDNKIRYDKIMFDMPAGERIVINDLKPNGLKCAYSINIERDKFEKLQVIREG